MLITLAEKAEADKPEVAASMDGSSGNPMATVARSLAGSNGNGAAARTPSDEPVWVGERDIVRDAGA